MTFEAHIKVRVKATSKMDASRKLSIMIVSSAMPMRDYQINDFVVVEED